MGNTLLKVEGLKVNYFSENGKIEAIKEVSFNVKKGETIGIIGESGSGKTSIAMAITGLLENNAEVKGKIIYEGVNLLDLKEEEINNYRWNKIAIVFQNRLDVLNPVLTIKEQITEVIIRHNNLCKDEVYKKVRNLFESIGLSKDWLNRYPHELSGGMRQKVLIAMALACEPDLLIVDEPTSSLDADSRSEIINLLKGIQNSNRKFSMIVVSHDLTLIKELTFKVLVLYSGHILEEGITREVIKNPLHPYTRGLLNSSPELNPYQDLWGIPISLKEEKGKGCPFYQRCNQARIECSEQVPKLKNLSLERKVACNRGGILTILEAKGICKKFTYKNRVIKACDNCNIDIKSGEIVALVGQSGSGKTTLANIISGFSKADNGEVVFDGNKIENFKEIRKLNGLQIIFQDPFSSINPNFTIEEAIREPLDILKIETKDLRKEKVKKILTDVQLPVEQSFVKKKCMELSGGQRQRVAIARGLIMEPKILIADEICSMLDPSTKANMLRLLKELQNKKGFSMLYITHDLNIARKISDRVFVMYNGNLVESGNAYEIFNKPKCNYTKKLIQKGFMKAL
ncbi:ABC transporter ATP-binding protein [Thermohalobacter berrensis]|uniref:ABC transporter ATP-binding protein n=1 Tax=Thermohalobacter berrensis TaxID=99594 RepID=A0A419T8B6_9FIRM|nr:ABC transporter ATP-binding protein [Thermohalobacter berrensis]RKD33794.1 ABC transporter ATP-binding protein [Thermohalobacter berrensis]